MSKTTIETKQVLFYNEEANLMFGKTGFRIHDFVFSKACKHDNEK